MGLLRLAVLLAVLLATLVALALRLAPLPGEQVRARGPAQASATPPPTVTPPPTDAPPARPTREPPPVARLTVGGDTQEACIGTFCWGGMCADLWGGWIAPTEPLRVRSPFKSALRIEVEPVPTGLYLEVYLWDERAGRPTGQGSTAFWPGAGARKVGPTYALPLAKAQDVQLSRPPGLYIIDLTAYWKGVGDAFYGFLVEVGP